MSTRFTRRSLATGIGTTGLGLGGLALLPPNASADMPFTSFAFPATGAPTARTMPDRLADIKNVLDFGADPTGSSDSQPAIQNAVNSLSGTGRGTIFFPEGTYTLHSPVTFNYNGNLSIHFLGADGQGAYIQGNLAGYLFDRSNVNSGSPNYTTGGRVFEKLYFSNSNTSGGCVRIGSTIGGAFRDCNFSGYVGITTEDSAGNSSQAILVENCTFVSPGTSTPQENLIIGGSGAVLGCDWHDVDTAIRLYGNGLHMAGNRIEHANNAYLIGLDSSGTAQGASGFTIGGSTEGCTCAVDLGGSAGAVCTGFLINTGANGHDKSNSGYPLFTQNSQYGFKVRPGSGSSGIFRSCTTTGALDVAGISIATSSNRTNMVFLNCTGAQGGGSGVGWVLPTNACTAFFNNCNIQPVWKYSQLPTGGNVFEGDEFSVSDINTATWGTTYTGGGANHGLVRWNGSHWTVVAI
jgi:Pectate lyase superfamily protein